MTIGDNVFSQVVCDSGQTSNDCEPDPATRITIFCSCAFAIVYFIVICYILAARLREYRTLPYSEVQVAIVFYRLQVATTVCLSWHVKQQQQSELAQCCHMADMHVSTQCACVVRCTQPALQHMTLCAKLLPHHIL